jgi:hypothetical protein
MSPIYSRYYRWHLNNNSNNSNRRNSNRRSRHNHNQLRPHNLPNQLPCLISKSLVAPPLTHIPVSQPSTTQGVDLQKILAVINAQKQIQQPNGFQQSQQSQSTVTPNLAAFISQFGSKNQPSLQSQSQTTSQPQQQQQIYEDPERKRMRETGGYDVTDDRYNPTKRSKTSGDPKQKKHVSGQLTLFSSLTVC